MKKKKIEIYVIEPDMAKQTLKDLRVIAKEHKIKGYYKMFKAKFFEILRDMGEEIPDDEPLPKKCPHGRVKYNCKECEGCSIPNKQFRINSINTTETAIYLGVNHVLSLKPPLRMYNIIIHRKPNVLQHPPL